MFRIMPDIQMSPLGGIMLWALIILVALGVALSAGPWGILVWGLASVVVVAAAFLVLKQIGGKLT